MKPESPKTNVARPTSPAADPAARLFLLSLYVLILLVPFATIPAIPTGHTLADSKLFAQWIVLGLAAVCGLLALIRQITAGSFRCRLHWHDLAFAAFTLATIVSAVNSTHSAIALVSGVPFWLLAAIYIFVQCAPLGPREAHKLAGLMILTGVLLGLQMLLDFYGISPLRALYPYEAGQISDRGIFVSALGNPEYAACFLTPLALFCLAGGVFPGRRSARAGWFVLCAFLLGCALLTQTRAVVLGLLGGLLVIVLTGLFRPRPQSLRSIINWPRLLTVALTTGGLFCAVSLIFSTGNPLNPGGRVNVWRRFGLLLDVDHLVFDTRLQHYLAGSNLYVKHPVIGGGFGAVEQNYFVTLDEMAAGPDGNVTRAFARQFPERLLKNLHNEWLELLVEHGICGFFLFSLTIILLLAGAFMLRANDNSDTRTNYTRQLAAHQFAAALGAYLFFFCTSFPLHTPERQCFFWLILLLLAKLLRSENPVPAQTIRILSATTSTRAKKSKASPPAAQQRPFSAGFAQLQPAAPPPLRLTLAAAAFSLCTAGAVLLLNRSSSYLAQLYIDRQQSNEIRLAYHCYTALDAFRATMREYLALDDREKAGINWRQNRNWRAARAEFELLRNTGGKNFRYLPVDKAISALETLGARDASASSVTVESLLQLQHFWQHYPLANAEQKQLLNAAYAQMIAELEARSGASTQQHALEWTEGFALFPPQTQTTPADRAEAVASTTVFEWSAVPNAEHYDFFLWKTGGNKPDFPLASIRTNRLERKLDPASIYCWQVTAVGKLNEDSSKLWCFRTH